MSSEDARARKRAKRSENAILGENGNRAETVEGSGSTPSTPVGEKAPSFDKRGISKKEARKMVDAKASEAQQHQQSVETARMATNSMLSGRVFGTKKSYSWLQRGPAAGGGFSSPSRLNTGASSPAGEKPGRPASQPQRHRSVLGRGEKTRRRESVFKSGIFYLCWSWMAGERDMCKRHTRRM